MLAVCICYRYNYMRLKCWNERDKMLRTTKQRKKIHIIVHTGHTQRRTLSINLYCFCTTHIVSQVFFSTRNVIPFFFFWSLFSSFHICIDRCVNTYSLGYDEYDQNEEEEVEKKKHTFHSLWSMVVQCSNTNTSLDKSLNALNWLLLLL